MKIVNGFLPISKADMEERGWHSLDFILISADAYVDHPSFGHAIISRVLEREGFKVGIIPQPDWNNIGSFKILGKPKYAFLVASGNIDSMVNHYTVSKKRRNTDSYSPGNKAGLRPDRPAIVYSNKLREAFSKDVNIIIGGLEPSLRRFAHYDYWQDKVRRSVLVDSQADLLIYGMGEHQTVEIANRLRDGEKITDLSDIYGTCYVTKEIPSIEKSLMLPSYNDVLNDKRKYAISCKLQYEEQNHFKGKL